MRLRTMLMVALAGAALVALRNRETFASGLYADPQANVVVKNLPDRQRIELVANQTNACQRKISGARPYSMAVPETDSFCGCKMGGLSLFLTKQEFLAGEFGSIRRYVEHRLQVQEIAARCAREAVVSL